MIPFIIFIDFGMNMKLIGIISAQCIDAMEV